VSYILVWLWVILRLTAGRRHKYTSLPMISEEEFLAQHPEHERTDPHDLMIARLNDEKAVREELEKQRKELLVRKQALISENKKCKDDLASLDEQLKKFSMFQCVYRLNLILLTCLQLRFVIAAPKSLHI
jgi:hypothetical protein